jgi:hypothetical protein
MRIGATGDSITNEPPGIRRIIIAGLAGALVDGIYFSTVARATGSLPYDVLQSIAAFWLGKAARQEGNASALLGLATHIVVAIMMAAGFAVAMKRLRFLRRSPWLVGPAYGLFLYAVMYFLVLPIRWPKTFLRFHGFISVLDVFAHMAVGLSIAFTLRWRGRSAKVGS